MQRRKIPPGFKKFLGDVGPISSNQVQIVPNSDCLREDALEKGSEST